MPDFVVLLMLVHALFGWNAFQLDITIPPRGTGTYLRAGELIDRPLMTDRVFEKIHVFGILINYKEETTVAKKLEINFKRRTSWLFESSDSWNIGELISLMARNICKNPLGVMNSRLKLKQFIEKQIQVVEQSLAARGIKKKNLELLSE